MTRSARFKSAIHAFTWFVFALLLVVDTAPVLAAGDAAVSEQDAAKVLLQDLDYQLARLEKLQESLQTKDERAIAETRLAAFRERRIDLRKKFNQAGYEVLKADVAVEQARLSADIARATTSEGTSDAVPQKVDLVLPGKIENVRAASGEKINAPQIPALLASLETEIIELEKRVNQMPISTERDATKRRVQMLRDRSVDLTTAFDKRRYDLLRADVKSEWDTVTR
ncbi:MAG: hypothetical protein QM715_03265 [Nibricoccus sp.]